MNIEREISKEFIFSRISDLDIYNFYMPWQFQLNKNCANPFTLKDSHYSFRIRFMDGKCFHKAYNSHHKGDSIDFVKDYFGIEYFEALEKIATDFGLKEGNSKTYDIIKSLPIIKLEESRPVKIIAESKKFGKEHIDYLGKRGLTINDLNIYSDTEILALKKFYIDGDPVTIKKNEVGFIYNIKSLNKVKVYLPERAKGFKFKSSIPFYYIHGLEDLNECDNLIIMKSVKEAWIVSKYLNLCTIVVQAENITALNDESISIINSKAKNVFTSFDADEPGKKASKELNHKTGWKWVNVPNKYLSEGIKDWSELVENYGIEELKEPFRKKKIIN